MFHSKCDNRGCTVTIVETNNGFVFAGYSNFPWDSLGGYHAANSAFLFLLSGKDHSSPSKMRLKNTYDADAVYCVNSKGPIFGGGGCDFGVEDSYVYLRLGNTYEYGPPLKLTDSTGCATLAIKEMEVYEVAGTSSRAKVTSTEHQTPPETHFWTSVKILRGD